MIFRLAKLCILWHLYQIYLVNVVVFVRASPRAAIRAEPLETCGLRPAYDKNENLNQWTNPKLKTTTLPAGTTTTTTTTSREPATSSKPKPKTRRPRPRRTRPSRYSSDFYNSLLLAQLGFFGSRGLFLAKNVNHSSSNDYSIRDESIHEDYEDYVAEEDHDYDDQDRDQIIDDISEQTVSLSDQFKLATTSTKGKGFVLGIAGGRPAEPGQFPSYVKIGFSAASLTYRGAECAGTLVGPYTVLSAAHCLRGISDLASVRLVVGLNSPQRSKQREYRVARVCALSKYCLYKYHNIHGRKNEVPLFDLLVLESSERIQYNDYIQPACVPFELGPEFRSNSRDQFEVTGLGIMDDERRIPKSLQFTRLQRNCLHNDARIYRRLRGALECYLGVSGTHTCPGDSGGPLYYYRQHQNRTRQFMIGALSFGTSHCHVGKSDNFFADLDFFERYMDELVSSCPVMYGPDYVDQNCPQSQP